MRTTILGVRNLEWDGFGRRAFLCEVLLSNQDDWSRYAVGRGPTEPIYGVANELWARAVIGGEWGPIGPINMEKVKTIIAYPMGAQSISNTNPAVVSFGLQPYYYRCSQTSILCIDS